MQLQQDIFIPVDSHLHNTKCHTYCSINLTNQLIVQLKVKGQGHARDVMSRPHVPRYALSSFAFVPV